MTSLPLSLHLGHNLDLVIPAMKRLSMGHAPAAAQTLSMPALPCAPWLSRCLRCRRRAVRSAPFSKPVPKLKVADFFQNSCIAALAMAAARALRPPLPSSKCHAMPVVSVQVCGDSGRQPKSAKVQMTAPVKPVTVLHLLAGSCYNRVFLSMSHVKKILARISAWSLQNWIHSLMISTLNLMPGSLLP